jgi:hypothetical protein
MERAELFPQLNDSIRSSAAEGPVTQTWEFVCECPDVTCHALVSLTLVEFDERRRASPPAPILAREHGARRPTTDRLEEEARPGRPPVLAAHDE